MKLFWSRFSPYVRKVMIVAHEAGLADRIETVDIEVSMSWPNRDLQKFNPLGQIPALVLDDGTVLHDSRVIAEYLDALGGSALFPHTPDRWDALRRHALGDGITDALIVWRQERLKPAERQTQAWLDTFAAKVEAALDRLEGEIPARGGAAFDIGDAAVGSALGYLDLRFTDIDWRSGRPALTAWHAGFEARPSAQATAPGLVQ